MINNDIRLAVIEEVIGGSRPGSVWVFKPDPPHPLLFLLVGPNGGFRTGLNHSGTMALVSCATSFQKASTGLFVTACAKPRGRLSAFPASFDGSFTGLRIERAYVNFGKIDINNSSRLRLVIILPQQVLEGSTSGIVNHREGSHALLGSVVAEGSVLFVQRPLVSLLMVFPKIFEGILFHFLLFSFTCGSICEFAHRFFRRQAAIAGGVRERDAHR